MDIEKIKLLITEVNKKMAENKDAFMATQKRAEDLIVENTKLQGELRLLSQMKSDLEPKA